MNYEDGYLELLAERSTLKAKNKMLLAALESLLDATERNVLHVDVINARVKAREAACEAIAKAKGGEE